jgi:uncharacterized membrane protein YgdD (TMEM256/DUF423 family)
MAAPTLMWRLGALSGASGVLLGAFGAHALKARVGEGSPLLATWSTAAQYQLLHAGAILVASSAKRPAASAMFFAGTVLFSGSLYALVLTGIKPFGAVAPIGGALLAGGWLALLL